MKSQYALKKVRACEKDGVLKYQIKKIFQVRHSQVKNKIQKDQVKEYLLEKP